MTTCNICAENLNKSTRINVECPYCNFDACRICWGKWFLDETNCKCMNPTCGKDWTRQHLKAGFTNKFITKDLKEHREQILFDQERALLPATQPFVEAIRLKDKHDINVRKVQRKINELKEHIYKLERDYVVQRRSLTGTETTRAERNVFVRACPDGNCRGFLSSQWKCGVCDKWACPECHEVKGLDRDVEHTCNPDNVATAQLLANDTKSCPTCGMGIFKIEGCFSKDTKIMLWDECISGFTKMSQDISIGDVLVGDDGTARTVSKLISGEDEMYEIKQTNGMDYIVNSKHTLVLQKCLPVVSSRESQETINISVCDYLKLTNEERSRLKGIRIKYLCNNPGYNFPISEIHLSEITVNPIGKFEYYGWVVDKNKRFLLGDSTVVHNCDQMWCTQCHTAFSFRTGRVETNVHNPHYYEWMRRNGGLARQAGDVPCGRELNSRFLDGITNIVRSKLRVARIDPFTSVEFKIIADIGRSMIHLNLVELANYRVDRVNDNQELRIDYLLNKITEEDFKIVLQRREKMTQKKREIHNIIRLIIDTVTDILYRFHEQINRREWNLDFSIIEEIHAIMKYADECLSEIAKTFDSKKLQLSRLGIRYQLPVLEDVTLENTITNTGEII